MNQIRKLRSNTCGMCRVWVALAILALGAGWARSAEAQGSAASGPRSGVWFSGQYFGFDPRLVRHEHGEPDLEPLEVDGVPLLDQEEFVDEGDACCDDDGCPMPLRFWARGEYVSYWLTGMHVPVLATTNPDGGVLPGATVLFGGTSLHNDMVPGGRFTLGTWLDDRGCDGIEASLLIVGQSSTQYSVSNADLAVIARPFINADPANLGQDARLIATPQVVQGSLNILASTNFYTFDLVWRHRLNRTECCQTDLLLGYRMAELADSVRIEENTTALQTAIAGTRISLVDQFNTRNDFHGAELGFIMQRQLNGCWSWDVTAKGAIGQMRSAIGITGSTRTTPSGGTSTFSDAGLLVQDTNSGSRSRNDMAGLGEFSFNLQRDFASGWRGNLGYSFLMVGNVLRAGDQIDTRVNTTQIPPGTLTGDPFPAVPYASSTLWVHGLQIGLERSF